MSDLDKVVNKKTAIPAFTLIWREISIEKTA